MLYVGAKRRHASHAFNAKTGAEEWAYVLWRLPRLSALASTSTDYQATVDGYLTVADVDFSNAFTKGGTSSDWRTLLVGSLGRGGKGIHALDVTDPSAANETAVAAKVLGSSPTRTPWPTWSEHRLRVLAPNHHQARTDHLQHRRPGRGRDPLGRRLGGAGEFGIQQRRRRRRQGYLFMLDAKTGGCSRP